MSTTCDTHRVLQNRRCGIAGGNWRRIQPPPIELDWKDSCMICYTGGTTGLPKGTILHYRCVTTNSVNTVVSWGLRPDDVIPQHMPFFHTRLLNVLTTPLVHIGGTSIVCGNPRH
ncbi:MAG: AMP-binding protein [Anaerolineae bacterium]|nr:AMP-binding protein [Anaerolineae bacterium]NIN93508.1 AMP-binding protein [Anaerolineae bacterium]NIQ76582.1 AMP-binding protein [Anaerolineae bacterium]